MSFNTLQLLPWDSDFLGFGVARLVLHDIDGASLAAQVNEAAAMEAQLLYIVTEAADERSNTAARQVGAVLVDRKVTFRQRVAPGSICWEPSANVKATTRFTAQLNYLALQSGEYSRYQRDENFAPGVYARLYQQWLRNSLSGELAHEVLVYEPPLAPAAQGLLTLAVQAGQATIGLLAVAEPARRQGIGQALLQAAQQRAAIWQLPEIQVATQLDNVRACNFYRKCGFVQAQVQHIYHLWLRRG
jgi:dTDP-4-amino-4,6-dideoxy-D-galactose acyltransferase